MATTERDILRTELRWAVVVGAAVALILVVIVVTSMALSVNPPSNVETLDPKTLHLSGEFTETNLGTSVGPDNAVTARIVATQFAFVPSCIAVPQGRRVTLRLASPDVIHGIIVPGTNVNTMVVPGFVAQVHTTFTRAGTFVMPCHEFCGLGHNEMWGKIQVVPESQWRPDAQGRVNCAPD